MDKFSRRNRQVNALAELKRITDPKLKEALVLATREGKRRGLTQSDLRAAWNARLTEEERVALSKVVPQKGQGAARRITAAEAVTRSAPARTWPATAAS